MISIDRIDPAGQALEVPADALRQGEALHRSFRPRIVGDYLEHLARMGAEGAGILQLVAEGEVRAIAVWRTYLTTYCGRRFEVDDLVTAEDHRSKGYGAAMIEALRAKARSLACDAVMLTSANWRTDAHRFYLREGFSKDAVLFATRL